MNHEKPLLVLKPGTKWIYSLITQSLIGLSLLNLLNAILVNILANTVFRLNWVDLLGLTQSEHFVPFSAVPRFTATSFVFLVIIATLLLWALIYLIVSLILVISPIYTLLALNYIKYEFYPNLLVVSRGIVIKVNKIYPYRSLTMVQHFQAVGDRMFGLGSLLIHEPQLGVLSVSGIENNLISELYDEFSELLLNHEIRLMEESQTNSIRMKSIVKERCRDPKEYTAQLIPALKEMNLLLNMIFQLLKKRIGLTYQ